ncbi:hypothetical protein VTJ04DRAFT_2707 [Mycothermus thermophilus]|uniref:uncharacterized protein n=1 Tax=Humicola insolens TaxID=85995 RepID=UPI003742A5D7
MGTGTTITSQSHKIKKHSNNPAMQTVPFISSTSSGIRFLRRINLATKSITMASSTRDSKQRRKKQTEYVRPLPTRHHIKGDRLQTA